MNRTLGIVLGLLAFAALCIFCIRSHAAMIEQDVMSRTTLALVGAGFTPNGMTVDGRDVSLAGSAGAPIVSDAARKLAEAVEGVRIVNVSFTGTRTAAIAQADGKTMPAVSPIAQAPAESQQAINTLLQTKTVEFNSDSAALTNAGIDTLDQIVPILKASPKMLCEISGYTDSQGDSFFNIELSKRRALATRDYLVNKGIEAERLSAAGFGDAKPIASNETEEGRRQNRRIEFLLKEKN